MTVPPTVERVVDSALESTIDACLTASNGRHADTFTLALDGTPSEAVLKLDGRSIHSGDVVEPRVVELVTEHTSVPVPSVLATGSVRDGHRGATRWALYERLPGAPPTPFPRLDLSIRESVVADIGTYLAELHGAVVFGRAGALAVDDGLVVTDPVGIDVRTLATTIDGLLTDEASPRRYTLSHGDLFPGNLLVDAHGNVRGVIDWADAHVSTPARDLAVAEVRFIDWFRLEDHEASTLRAALRRGYRRSRSLPPGYPEHVRLYKATWLAEATQQYLRTKRYELRRRPIRRRVASRLTRGLRPGGVQG